MKKFLALLFVCAGMTAMAGVPQVNKADFQSAKGQKVMKANTLSHELSAPAMQSQSMLTPRQVMKQHGMSLQNNNLMKRAPRRLSDDEVAANTYLDFRYQYVLTDSGIVETDPHYLIHQGTYWLVNEGQLYAAGIVWSPYSGQDYYHPIDIDYTTGAVSYATGYLIDDDTLEGSYNSQTKRKVDTVIWSAVVDADFYFNGAESFSPVTGNILDDGSIVFNDSLPFVVFGYQALNTYTRTGNAMTGYRYVLEKSDTIEDVYMYFGNQFLVPNATHENTVRGTSYTDDVYMLQTNDTTVVTWGLWGMGMPGTVMYIHEDGTMDFPAQYVYDAEGDDFANSTFELDADHGFIFDADGYVDGFVGFGNQGNVTPEAITWDHTVLATQSGSLYYPFYNNVLKFKDGQFILPAPEIVRGDVNNDGAVNISDVTVLINHLLSQNFDDADNFSSDNSDCNEDGSINIGDVTSLINYLLKGAW